ncbi:bifunctional metallophosphatase/5'-nucleotidase [Roseimarinus sediminis]|uniref:bifunctional metallophosphatase/5'-nucleotidase n=1 Tax=Roseimarinus sediminis TaxID=1610899 RepID=UPI003D1F8FE9
MITFIFDVQLTGSKGLVRKYAFLLAASLFFALTLQAQDLLILHTNDIHSHLNGFSPEAEYTPLLADEDPTRGGLSRIAGFIGTQKEKHPDELLVLDGGDFLMGTLFQTIETDHGFQLRLMKKMGYDFLAIGNHEFDFGPDTLAQIILSARERGPIPQLLCANYKGADRSNDERFLQLFADSTILPYSMVERNGYRIGIFGLLGHDAQESIASYYGISIENPKKTARNTARYLKQKEKADLVIALSHSGLARDKKGEWKGEDFSYAKAASDIDIIISGHSHSKLEKPLQAGNAIVVQTGAHGTHVGRIEVRFDSFGKPLVQYQLVPMDDRIAADPSIQNEIDAEVPAIEDKVLSKLDVGFNEKIVETSFDLVMNEHEPGKSNLGPFVADAIHNTLNQKYQLQADVVLVAAGVIRNNIQTGKSGYQNISDLFNVVPLGKGKDGIPGTPLGRVYVNGHELKQVMELVLSVYRIRSSFYLYFSGMRVEYQPHKGLFKKISSIQIGNDQEGYRSIDISKHSRELVAVAANSYMIGFIGHLKSMSKGIVDVVPKNAAGEAVAIHELILDTDPARDGIQEVKEWLLVYHFVKAFKDADGDGVPEIPEHYRNKGNLLIE